MSLAHSTAPSSFNLQLVFNNALQEYERQTKISLLAHPLAARLQPCDSPSAILALLREQVEGLHQSRDGDDKWTEWLDPTVNVLDALSLPLGEHVSLVCLEASTVVRSVSHINSAGYLTSESNFYRGVHPFFGAYLLNILNTFVCV
jgi:hypothetical protein